MASCQKQQTLQSKSNELIEFDYGTTHYQYTGSQVGNVNEPTTTWYTRIQTEGNASHFELLLSDTIVGTYSLTASDITILFGDKYYKPHGANPLTAIITKYDTVGGYIEGTFSGHAQRYLGGSDTTEVDFNNGTFKVVRDFSHS
jgi:hypothetical protein